MKLLIDFDSTFVQLETLDLLAEIAGCDQGTLVKIKHITDQAMAGELSFYQALSQRLALITLEKKHVQLCIKYLKNKISTSFVKNKDWLKAHANNIFILSGGFKEIIVPIAAEFNIPENQVYANEFIYDQESNSHKIIGIDQDNYLAHDNGKAKAAKKFLQPNEPAVILGDGYNDFLLKKSGLVQQFYLYTENIHRKNLDQYADLIINSLDGVTGLFENGH